MQQAELGLEGSRLSESALGGHTTAPSEAPAGLGAVGHAPASPLISVQQRLRKLSAQSQSGFSGSGLPHSAVEGRPGYLISDRTVDRGQAGFLQGSHGAAHPQLNSGGGDMQWGRLGNWQGPSDRQGSGERQSSGPSRLLKPLTLLLLIAHSTAATAASGLYAMFALCILTVIWQVGWPIQCHHRCFGLCVSPKPAQLTALHKPLLGSWLPCASSGCF